MTAGHLDPRGTPAPARVARFFDNGEKTVVRLQFAGQALVCTPEHPFYVVDRGWVCAEELVEGDLCLNSKGGTVAFVSREALAETRRVYNIEVAEAHTYFVGDGDGGLAHNRCNECGAGWYNVGHKIFGCPVANARNREKIQNLGLTGLSAVDEVQTHENAKWAEEAAVDLASTLPGTDTIMDLAIATDPSQSVSTRVTHLAFAAVSITPVGGKLDAAARVGRRVVDLDALKTPLFIKKIVKEGKDQTELFTKKVREYLPTIHKGKYTPEELEEEVTNVVNAFTEIKMVTLPEDVTVIRYYSKKKTWQKEGSWRTFEKGTRDTLALLRERNDMDAIVVSTIPKGVLYL